jgi:hypothetical protein
MLAHEQPRQSAARFESGRRATLRTRQLPTGVRSPARRAATAGRWRSNRSIVANRTPQRTQIATSAQGRRLAAAAVAHAQRRIGASLKNSRAGRSRTARFVRKDKEHLMSDLRVTHLVARATAPRRLPVD